MRFSITTKLFTFTGILLCIIGYASLAQAQESQSSEPDAKEDAKAEQKKDDQAAEGSESEVDLLQPTEIEGDYGAVFVLQNLIGFGKYEKQGETNRELLYSDSYINQTNYLFNPLFEIIGFYNYDYYSHDNASVSGGVELSFFASSQGLFDKHYPSTTLSLVPFDVDLPEKAITSEDLGLEEGVRFNLGRLAADLSLNAVIPGQQKAYEDFELKYSAGLGVTHITDGFGKFPLTFINDSTAIFGSLVSIIELEQPLFDDKENKLSITDALNVAGINIKNTTLKKHIFQLSFQNYTRNTSGYSFGGDKTFAKYAEQAKMYNRVRLLYVYAPLSLVNQFDVYRSARTPNNAFDSDTKGLTLAYTVQYAF